MHPQAFLAGINNYISIIIDTGASLCVTFDRNDFISELKSSSIPRQLGGLANGLPICGKGMVEWTFISDEGKLLSLTIEVYYVPSAGQRLLSPQALFQQSPYEGKFEIDKEDGKLFLENLSQTLTVPLNRQNNLPVAKGILGKDATNRIAELNLAVEAEKSQNLSSAQLSLLRWHCRLGHVNMATIQQLLKSGALGTSRDTLAASKCALPKCASCIYGKQSRRPTGASTTKPVAQTVGSLKADDIFPGQRVSMDHFICSAKGRLYSSMGKTSEREMFSGGCIFVDHASGHVHVEHQVSFTAAHTLESKHRFERKMRNYGVTVLAYQSDNGVFSAAEFVEEITRNNQQIRYSGVGAHHQNGVAERAIGTIMRLARTMMLHAAIRWPDVADPSLWPMAVDYGAYLYNHLPTLGAGIAPLELLTRTIRPRHYLQHMHVWGCPVYVLDPTLQDGRKIPRWKPRSRRSIFVGISPIHAHTVPLVMSCSTLAITPQFHVIFDDWFTTTTSQDESDDAPEWWGDLLDSNRFRYAFDEPLTFDEAKWIQTQESTFQRYAEQREQVDHTQLLPLTPFNDTIQSSDQSKSATTTSPSDPTTTSPGPNNEPTRVDTDIEALADLEEDLNRPSLTTTNIDSNNNVSSPEAILPDTEVSVPMQALRRSQRTRRPPQRYASDEGYGFLTPCTFLQLTCNKITNLQSQRERDIAYQDLLRFDFDSNALDDVDPMCLVSNVNKDTDTLRYHEAMLDKDAEGFKKAMVDEIKSLQSFEVWDLIERKLVTTKILPSTWTFRKKRHPDGTIKKLKARFCARGDKQVPGIDYFESYAPVVSWSTVRLMLIFGLAFKLKTQQVDYVNAFAQGDLQEQVHLELPQGFQVPDNKDYVLRLRKSLYGLVQSPRAFFIKLSNALKSRNFQQSKLDPCLFMHKKIICIVYVDDCIFFAKNDIIIQDMIKSLKSEFRLEVEGEVDSFLGIKIVHQDDDSYKLLQIGLKQKIIHYVGLTDGNPDATPASSDPLGSNKDGAPFTESWSYASAVGMLLYLSTNSHPEISFAVHQCARFTHNPRAIHGKAIKRICRYLLAVKNDGLILKPTNDIAADCFVDADFAGLWGSEHHQDATCAKSRTGYILVVAGCPVIWVSKLQTEIALSTLEAEYIALSQAMRDLIPMRVVIQELSDFLNYNNQVIIRTHSNVFEDNNGALLLANVPRLMPRSKHIAVKYHFFRHHVENGDIRVLHIASNDNLADLFTKGLPKEKFLYLRRTLCGY
jgi:hypothetical protein